LVGQLEQDRDSTFWVFGPKFIILVSKNLIFVSRPRLLLIFNTLPIYRKRSKRFAKISKGAPTYSMVLKQSVLGGVRGLRICVWL
jgi:hypothetical protein